MADGVTGETGETVAPPVELDSKNALAPVPIRLHLMGEHNVQGTIKKKSNVIMAHVQVSR